MKRLTALILTMALLCTLLIAPSASAASYATATVVGGWLRLRAEPNDDSQTISAYFTGTTVTILGGSGQWYHVLTPDGKTGYMYSGYLNITGSITGGQLDENTAATVISANGKPVRLRSGPSTQYSIIASYAVGTPLTVLSSGDTWCKVRINGRTGYMMTEFISILGAGETTGGYTAYVVSDNGKNCVLREGPSKQHDILASYPVGTRVTVVSYGSTWSKLSVNGLVGYMMSQYLSTTEPDHSVGDTAAGYTAYVTSSNGLGVRMRSGAGKLFPTIATYSVGTQVTVLEYGSTWCRIRVGTRTGYMMTEFLTTRAPSLVSSVSISAATVWPGQTLTATVSPASATVTITWLNDKGQTLGYGSSYTVQTSDAGRRIRASVTGTGSTSGAAVSSWATVQGSGTVTTTYMLTGVTISDTSPVVGQTIAATIRPSGATASISWFRENGTFIGSGSTYTVRSADLGYRLYAFAEGTNATTGDATSSLTSPVSAAAVSTISLTGVRISDTTPTVGQTLTATVYPSGATAAYTWRCSDGRILGYNSSYTVTAEDVGKAIFVVANGTGNTSGSVMSDLTSSVQTAAPTLRIDNVTLNDLTPVVGQTLVATVEPGAASAILTWFRDDDVILTYGSTYTVQPSDLGHAIYVWAEGTNGTYGSATSRVTAPVSSGGTATRSDIP